MKKLLLLLIICMCFPSIVFAELKEYVSEKHVSLTSHFVINEVHDEQNNKLLYQLQIFLQRSRIAIGSWQTFNHTTDNMVLSVSKFVHQSNEPSPKIILSFKNTPYIEITSQSETKTFDWPKNKLQVNSSYISGRLNKTNTQDIVHADKIKIIFRTEDGAIKTFELPIEIIDEWKQIVTGNIVKRKKELLNN